MREAFKLLISLTLSGSVLILALLLLRPLLKDRLSKRWQYYIWLLVIVRLLLPIGPPESPVNDAVISMNNAAVSVIGYDPGHGSADTNPEFEAEFADPEPTALQEFATSVWTHMWVIWLTGALVLLIRKLTAYQSFNRYIRTGWEPVDDPALLDRLAEIGLETGIKRPIELYVNPLAASPMLLGIHKPCIVLPTAALPDEDLRYILLHELTHYRRRDLLYKWLMQVTLCIHWFNPLVHWMSRESERLGELSCDEAVIKKLDEPGRRAYGDALLRTMAAGGGYKATLPSATLGESGKLLKERLETIMKFKKPTKLAAVLSVLLAIILTATGTAAGAYTGVPAIEGPDILSGSWAGAWAKGSRFTREAHYAKPYMFDIGWNCFPKDNSIEVTLPGGSKMKVWYSDGVAALGLGKDKAAQKALSEVIVQLWKDTKDTEFPLTSPMVFYYENFGESATPEFAEEYYEDGNLPMFKTVFAMLSKPEQTTWLSKIYSDDDIAFFSVAADGLKTDSDLVKSFAEKAYTNGKFSFFSVLTNRMSKDTLESWLLRAKKDKAAAFQSILMQHMGQYEELEKLEAELDKKQDEEYKKVGITRDGGTYYYQGEKLYIFLDYQPDNAFYTMAMNPKVKNNKSVKIVRNAAGKITGTAYLTEAEIADLFGDKDDDDDDWDDNGNRGKDWDIDWDWDWNWDWDDFEDDALKEAYKAVGVTVDGKNYYYDGKLVKIFLDHYTDSSFYRHMMNPEGSVNIKIVRDENNKITGAAPLTQAEIDRYFVGVHDEHVVDVDIDKVSSGEYVWLGEFELEKGDRIYYDVTAESGERLTVGFAKTRTRKPNTTYMTVTNHREAGEDLEVTAGPLSGPETAGKYHLFINTKGGELKNVTGYITIVKASETE